MVRQVLQCGIAIGEIFRSDLIARSDLDEIAVRITTTGDTVSLLQVSAVGVDTRQAVTQLLKPDFGAVPKRTLHQKSPLVVEDRLSSVGIFVGDGGTWGGCLAWRMQ